MVTINLAYTAPINPSGAIPTLDEAQIWTGLKRKVKRAYEFVPVITDCKVISEEGDVVVREATFVDAPRPIREVCTHLAPSRVDFKQENDSTISNIVSKGPEGELLMTYAFEWRHPDVEAGSAEELKLRTSYEKLSKIAVEGSINTIRRLVKEGEIA